MNRQILFRGKRIHDREWIYGIPIFDFTHIFNSECNDSVDNYEVFTNTIGEFTGLTDKNGVKIFEGDYLFDLEIDRETQIDLSSKHPVVYDNCHACFCVDTSFLKNGSYLVPILQYFTREQLEVIGNIHDK